MCETLKKCPLCNGNTILKTWWGIGKYNGKVYCVNCGCGLEMSEYDDQAELVHDITVRWNRRVPQI